MKIKKVIFIFSFIMVIIFGTNVTNAASVNLSATSENVNIGDNATINATFTAAAWNINVSGNGISGGNYASQTDDLSEKTTTKTFKLDTSKEGTYTIKMQGDITDENGKTTKIEKSITVKVNKSNSEPIQSTPTTSSNTTTASKSTEARLSNFGIKPNDFSGFKRDKTEYSTEVPNNVTKVNVYATALDKNAKVSGAGDVQLKEGENTVKVTVTAEAGNTKVYTLTIKRRTAAEDATATTNDDTTTTNTEATTSDAFGLESLDIKDVKLKPSFKTEIYKYEIDLNKDLSQLDISAIPTDDDTTVEIAGNEDLKDGENLITIVVANKKTKETATYQITVNKNVEVETESNGSEQVEEFSWLKPSTWGKEDIIKGMIIAVLLLLIIIAIILKVKLSKEKKEAKNIDLPGADELDKAIAEHQELSELERLEMNIFDTNENNDTNSMENRAKRRGKHF